MAIFITGDTHGGIDLGKLYPESFDHTGLTRDDYVIVLGDFALPWHFPESPEDTRLLDWLDERPWTTLFVDGNHENYSALRKYKAETWHGGTVHVLRRNVLHLERAQVFEIGGRSFFAMGGAHSVDREFRTPYKGWWPQEVPSAEEREAAVSKIAAVGRVDYVITHCPPTQELYDLAMGNQILWARPDEYNNWLQTEIADKLEFSCWLYGHMHVDDYRRTRYKAFYNGVVRLEELDTWSNSFVRRKQPGIRDCISRLRRSEG